MGADSGFREPSQEVFSALSGFNPERMAAQIAQLRHAYSHLKAERVIKQAEFADGLIAPAIRFLEALAAQGGRNGEGSKA